MEPSLANRPRRKMLRPKFPKVDWLLLPKTFAYLTSWYGLFVGKFPFQVLSVSIGIGLLFSFGFYRIQLQEVKSEDYLPTNSPSITERTKVLLFDVLEPDNPTKTPFLLFQQATPAITAIPPNNPSSDDNETTPEPLNRVKRAQDLLGKRNSVESCRPSAVLIVAKQNASDPDGKLYNLLNFTMLREISRLEDLLYNTSATLFSPIDGKPMQFFYEQRGDIDTSVCTRQPTGECGGFTLRNLRYLFGDMDVISPNGDALSLFFSGVAGYGITYPKFANNDFSKFFALVETNDAKTTQYNSVVKRVGAIRETYCVNEYFADSLRRSSQVWISWEKAFDASMRTFHSPYFDVYWASTFQRNGEQLSLITEMIPKIGLTFIALMIWCCVGSLSRDALQSKPWSGIIGVLSTFFACTSGFGICLWVEPKFNPILMAVPLLVLAIGLDDMFIMLEAWSRTDPTFPVEERMMLSMHIGGTSIFITFFINLIDFVVGNFTPFPIINSLSIYAIAAMVFDFFFQMTIFSPSLVLFGSLEKRKLHSCCCCQKLKPRQEDLQTRSALSLICCASVHEDKATNDGSTHDRILQLVTEFLTWTPVRVLSMFLFFLYVGASIWSVTNLEIGLKPERVYRTSSNMFSYTYYNRFLFSHYADEINVVVNNELDYSQHKIRRKLLDFIDKAHLSGYFWREETKCWLADFVHWAKASNISLASMRNNTDVVWHIQRFPQGFLDSSAVPGETSTSYFSNAQDIRIDLNATTIKKSRFRLRAKDMTGPARQLGMMTKLREIIDSYKPEIEIYAYAENFLLYDQFLTAVPTTLYYCGMTLGATMAVAIFLIPHPACLFWVLVFVSSVLVGIVGMMRFWDMDLDSISLINLLVAISFCSDLIAHPIYIFMVSKVRNTRSISPKQVRLLKTAAVIEEVSVAAIPACIGTTLAVIAMSTSDAYIFSTFFRVMFLSVVLSILHAFIFIPAFLSFLGPSNAGVDQLNRRPTDDSSSAPCSPPTKNKHGLVDTSRARIDRLYDAVVVRRRQKRPPSYMSSGSYASYSEEDVYSFSAFIPAHAMVCGSGVKPISEVGKNIDSIRKHIGTE